jgi:hypothetical protein
LFFLHLDLLWFRDEVQVLQVEEYGGEWLLRKAIGRLQLFEQAEMSPERFNRCQFSPVHRRRLLVMQAYQYFTRKLLKHALKIKMNLMKCIHPFTKSQELELPAMTSCRLVESYQSFGGNCCL